MFLFFENHNYEISTFITTTIFKKLVHLCIDKWFKSSYLIVSFDVEELQLVFVKDENI